MKEIRLEGERGRGIRVMVDDDDYKMLSEYRWNYDGKYATTSLPVKFGRNKKMRMHRMIMGVPDKHVDHINGNRLDNRRENLRSCTHAENLYNQKVQEGSKTGYRGVRKCVTKTQRGFTINYSVTIKKGSKTHYIGVFNDADHAAIVYNHYAKELFGEFARPNAISHNLTVTK